MVPFGVSMSVQCRKRVGSFSLTVTVLRQTLPGTVRTPIATRGGDFYAVRGHDQTP